MNQFDIPVYKPALYGNEKRYVNECLDSTWISSRGEFIQRFEAQFSRFIGSRFSSTVCNGTVALHLALLALGLKPGDEVIVPTFTYIASVNAIRYVGAEPVFVDSLPDAQIDAEDVRRKITPRTRAIMVVHLYGHPCDLRTLKSIAETSNLFLVEDCAEAFGSYFQNQHVGTTGTVSVFSFFGNKTITTGEGGMVCTQDPDLHRRIAKLKSQGLSGDKEYWHDEVGYNFRMTNICAAIGLAQLENATKILERKRELAERYQRLFASLPMSFLGEPYPDRINSFWMIIAFLHDPGKRDALRNFLKNEGVETRPTFYLAHTMPMYDGGALRFPVAEKLAASGVNFPSYPDLTEQEFEVIEKALRRFFASDGAV